MRSQFFWKWVRVNPCVGEDVMKVNKSACRYDSFRDSVVLVKVMDDISTSTFTATVALKKQQQSMKAVLQALLALTAAAGSALGLALTPMHRGPYCWPCTHRWLASCSSVLLGCKRSCGQGGQVSIVTLGHEFVRSYTAQTFLDILRCHIGWVLRDKRYPYDCVSLTQKRIYGCI